MSRGLKNNNPGNIRQSATRYKGEAVSSDSAFKAFETPAWGYRAIFMLLHTYQVRHGLNTLRRMIHRYAPPSENHTNAYVEFIAQRTGIADDERIDTLSRLHMIPVACAISRMENGVDAVEADVEAGWTLFKEG